MEGINAVDAISNSPTPGRAPTLLSTSSSKFGGQVSVHQVLMCQVLFATLACIMCPAAPPFPSFPASLPPCLPASLPLSHFLLVTVHCPLCHLLPHL